MEGIRAHLDAGGKALIPPFIPLATPESQLGRVRAATAGLTTIAVRDHLGQPVSDDATAFTFLLRRANMTAADEAAMVSTPQTGVGMHPGYSDHRRVKDGRCEACFAASKDTVDRSWVQVSS